MTNMKRAAAQNSKAEALLAEQARERDVRAALSAARQKKGNQWRAWSFAAAAVLTAGGL